MDGGEVIPEELVVFPLCSLWYEHKGKIFIIEQKME